MDGVVPLGSDLSAFPDGEFYANEFLPAYKEEFGTEPTSVFHAHAYDAVNVLFEAIERSADRQRRRLAHDPADGAEGRGLRDQRVRGDHRHDHVHAAGDCATDVTIGVYKAPNVVPSKAASDGQAGLHATTKSLDDVL